VKEGAMNQREQSMNPNEPSKENTCLRAARPHRQAAGILRLFVLCCAQHKTNNVVIIVMLFPISIRFIFLQFS